MVKTVKIDDGIESIIPPTKIKAQDFYKSMLDYPDGLEFKIINIGTPKKSFFNNENTNKQYFFMDIQYEMDGIIKQTGISYNLGEPIGVNTFRINPTSKLFDFIKLLYPKINTEHPVNIDFNVVSSKLNGLKFKGEVIAYFDNKRQLQHMLTPLKLL